MKKQADSGHDAGTENCDKPINKQSAAGAKDKKTVVLAFVPRLLDLHGAAHYLGVSYWMMRDLVNGGQIQAKRLPCLYTWNAQLKTRVPAKHGASVRRILIDRKDLDAFVDRLPSD